jgi:drug/metabolite transporter (DMT)-like permease
VQPHLIALILLAAAMHASWNAIVKSSAERTLTFAVVVAMGAVYAPLMFTLPPPARACVPYLAATTLIHHLYYVFLLSAYRWGDLSQVYPIARGTGPLLVALATVSIAGEPLRPAAALGVALICGGVFYLVPRESFGDRGARRAVLLALGTGVLVAGYTLTDGLGVRASGNPLSYVVWGNCLSALPFPLTVFWLNRRRLGPFLRAHGLRAATGGFIAVLSYSIAVWAMSSSALAAVASLRETSVLIAALLGSRMLGEPFGKQRIVASGFVVAGIVALGLA